MKRSIQTIHPDLSSALFYSPLKGGRGTQQWKPSRVNEGGIYSGSVRAQVWHAWQAVLACGESELCTVLYRQLATVYGGNAVQVMWSRPDIDLHGNTREHIRHENVSRMMHTTMMKVAG